MPEIGTSGSMSGDGKRSAAAWPKLPRPSSTLPFSAVPTAPSNVGYRGQTGRHMLNASSSHFDPNRTSGRRAGAWCWNIRGNSEPLGFRTIQVFPKDLPCARLQAERAGLTFSGPKDRDPS